VQRIKMNSWGSVLLFRIPEAGMMRTAFRLVACLLIPASSFLSRARAEDAALAAKAQGIFKAYCYRCHGPAPE